MCFDSDFPEMANTRFWNFSHLLRPSRASNYDAPPSLPLHLFIVDTNSLFKHYTKYSSRVVSGYSLYTLLPSPILQISFQLSLQENRQILFHFAGHQFLNQTFDKSFPSETIYNGIYRICRHKHSRFPPNHLSKSTTNKRTSDRIDENAPKKRLTR